MGTPKQTRSSLPDDLRRRLDDAHRGLLHVHKALLDHQRARYEREGGRINGPLEFLQVVLQDPSFAWLRPLSELAVQIDEFTASKKPADPAVGQALLAQTRTLLEPVENDSGFPGQYFLAMQESPVVAMAHAQWKRS